MSANGFDPRISVNPSSYPPDMPFPEIVERVARLGIRAIDGPRARLTSVGWENGLRLLEESGLAVTTLIHRTMYALDEPDTWDDANAEIRRDDRRRRAPRRPRLRDHRPGAGRRPDVGGGGRPLRGRRRAAAAYARERGVRLMIETTQPLFADYHFTHTLRDTVDLCERAGIDVCLDVHATWNERDLQATIERAGSTIGLVQLSDYSHGMRTLDRGIPGDGVMPLERILRWVLDTGYDGRFDLELWGDSGIDDDEAILRGARNVAALLERVGA